MRTLKTILLLSVATSTGICALIGLQAATAQLSLEPPELVLNGPPTNFTADQEDRDIDIDPGDELPANGTVSIGTAGATDMDINEFPPVGVSVIIQNGTIMVTNHTVDVYTDLEEEAAVQAIESNDDDGGGSGDNEDESD